VSLLTSGQGGGGPEFRLAGIPIRLEWTFLLFTVLIGSTLGDLALFIGWVVVVTLSILVHELGHAAALRGWGIPSRIVLHGLGGLTMHATSPPSRWGRIAVSLAGPFTGIVLFGLPAVLLEDTVAGQDPWHDIVRFVVWVNVGWAVVNLLPVLPLDGGNVALELLGERPTRVLSILVAAAVGAWALTEGFAFGAVFAAFFVIDNVRSLGTTRERGAATDLQAAAQALERGDLATARRQTDEALAQSRDAKVKALATELAAWTALEEGDPARARQLVEQYPRGIRPSGHLRAFTTEPSPAEQVNATVDAWLDRQFLPPRSYTHHLAAAGLVDSRADDAEQARMGLQHALFLGGQFDASARLGEAMLGAGSTEPVVAYNTACAHARAGRLDRAFAWLGRAVDLGFRDGKLLADDPDLATVRADPRYAILRNRLT
jgi:Zn-dependent protease